jgi:hypothetical protein
LHYYGVLSDLHDCGGGIRAAAAARNGTTYLDQPFVVGSDRFSGDFIAGVIPVRANLVRSLRGLTAVARHQHRRGAPRLVWLLQLAAA